jgi:hypothetical protein
LVLTITASPERPILKRIVQSVSNFAMRLKIRTTTTTGKACTSRISIPPGDKEKDAVISKTSSGFSLHFPATLT